MILLTAIVISILTGVHVISLMMLATDPEEAYEPQRFFLVLKSFIFQFCYDLYRILKMCLYYLSGFQGVFFL